jgi:hypothetical protein
MAAGVSSAQCSNGQWLAANENMAAWRNKTMANNHVASAKPIAFSQLNSNQYHVMYHDCQ